MAVRTILLLAFIATVAAVPSGTNTFDDEIMPEMELFQDGVESDQESFDEAKARVKELMSEGKSDKDCRKLADEEEAMIKKDVKNNKKILDALSDGSSCLTLGDKAVKTAKKDLDKAKKNKKDTAAALTKAQSAPVKFATVAWSSLTVGQCSTFFNQASYKTATNAVTSAKKAKEKADGALPVAQKAYDNAVASAKKQKKECLCKAKKAHDKAWDAYKKTEPANKKAWTRAAHLKCVLDGTPLDKCKVTPCPSNSKPKLVKEAANVSGCTAPPPPPAVHVHVTDIPGCKGMTVYGSQGSCDKKYNYQQTADFWCQRKGFKKGVSWTQVKGSQKLCYISGDYGKWTTMDAKKVKVSPYPSYGCSGHCKCFKDLKCAK